MANPNYLLLATLHGQILYSGVLPSTAPAAVYAVPQDTSVKITHGAVCNTSAATVTVSVALNKSGDVADGTHTLVAQFPLVAGDTLSLKDYLAGARLGPGESVWITAGQANALAVVLCGAVASTSTSSLIGFGVGGFGIAPFGV